jgi:excisionase family DNA binding protein
MIEPLLTVRAAADVLGVRENTLRIWLREGRLPMVRVGRLVKVRPEALKRFVEKNTR